MRHILPVLLLLLLTQLVYAQGVSLDTDKRKFSYAIGVQIGQSLVPARG